MKICLAYTPFHRPNSIPFGIAYLKSYLERNIPKVRVKNLDLNVMFFNRIIQKGLNGLGKHCLSNNLKCIPLENLIVSGEIKKISERLKKRPSTQKDFNLYVNDAYIFEKFYKDVIDCYQPFFKYFIERDILPGLLEKILHQDVERILAEKPKIIGFSILAANNLPYSLALAKLIKSKTKVPVILGGAMMAHLDARELLEAFDFIDFIFHGESEKALEKFVKFFPSKKYDKVPNLAYRKGPHIQVKEREYINDLDIIPFPDFSDFDLDSYISAEKVLPIISSRGCYWRRCTFCTHNLPYSNHLRCRRIKNVIDELEAQVAEFKIRHFLFVDESISPTRLREMSEEILKRDLHVYYGAEGMRPENDLSYELLKKSYNSGLRWIYVGVESVTQRLLNKMDKGTKVETIKRIIENCYKIGICPFISYIIGFPSQTEKELREECLFLKEHLPYGTVESSLFTLLKGSSVLNNPDKYKIAVHSQKVLFEMNNKVVHSPVFDFVSKKGLTKNMAMKIADNELFSESHTSFDEITNTVLSATKFRLSSIDIKTDHLENYISSAIKTLKMNKIKIEEDYRHFLLGISYRQLNQFEQALEEFELVEKIALEEKFKAKIHFLLGECYERIGQYRKAIHSYEKALKIFLDNGAIYLGLGRAFFYLKEYKEAIKRLYKAIELNYKGGDVRLLLGFCYEKIKNHKKAISMFKKAEKIEPEEPRINFSLFRCYRRIGQVKQANKELDKWALKFQRIQRRSRSK
jgi:anaerobic magnesium-protoporphyrin IX monomethyl ester cyclase